MSTAKFKSIGRFLHNSDIVLNGLIFNIEQGRKVLKEAKKNSKGNKFLELEAKQTKETTKIYIFQQRF